MRDRLQDHRDAIRIGTVPQQITALFCYRRRERVKEPLARHRPDFWHHNTRLAQLIAHNHRDRHGQPSPRMICQILDQRFLKRCRFARKRQRQIQLNSLTRLGC